MINYALLPMISLSAAAAAWADAPDTAASAPLAVVELFTSQGCGMCPAANLMMAEIGSQSDALILSFSVDYWDPLGWEDTYARPEFTARQKAYAEILDNRMVYTPQLVLNGATDQPASGRHAKSAQAVVRAAAAAGTNYPVAISADWSSRELTVQVSSTMETPQSATVWLIGYEPGALEIDVKGGANRGETVTVFNPVLDITRIGRWDGTDATLTTPPPSAGAAAILVQSGDIGAVMGTLQITAPT